MFITENQSISESILFLLSARESLCHMVETSSVEYKSQIKNFLMNEASDYEIIYMLMHEEMPNEKYNFVDEIKLFSKLKEQVLVNSDILTKCMGESVQTFIDEVDTVYPEFSSAAPILEFQLATKDYGLSEEGGIGDIASGGGGGAISFKKIFDILGKPGRDAIAHGKDQVAVIKLANKGMDPKLAWKAVRQQKTLLKKVGDADAYVKGTGLGKFFTGIADTAQKAGAAVSAKASSVAGAASKSGIINAFRAKVVAAGPALSKAVSSPSLVGAGLTGAALGALALYASVKLYKRFMSKAAKSCKGQSGAAKTLCIKKFQHDAIGAQIKDLESAMNACAKAKNPEKCKIPIQKKIGKLKLKMQKMKAKMA